MFWKHAAQQGLQFYIDMFHDMKDTGLFSGDFIDKALIQFCFMSLIQVSYNIQCGIRALLPCAVVKEVLFLVLYEGVYVYTLQTELLDL